MNKLTEIGFFAGIGGFTLASERTGAIACTQHIEIDPIAQKVLRDNFPEIPIHDDIKTYQPEHGAADLYTIGFPCTQTSNAGTRTGLAGKDSGLWFEALRCIIAGEPAFIVIENPTGLVKNGLRTVLAGLRVAGYQWEDPFILSSAMLGAADRRERLFVIAYHDRLRWRKFPGRWTEQMRAVVKAKRSREAWPQFVASDDGITARVSERLGKVPTTVTVGMKGRLNSRIVLGRSVVPAVAAVPLERIVTLSHCVENLNSFREDVR